MSLFKDDKEGARIAAEVKDATEVVKKLSEEVKMLRKEVEFFSALTKKNEENNVRNEKVVQELDIKIKQLLKILELSEKDLPAHAP